MVADIKSPLMMMMVGGEGGGPSYMMVYDQGGGGGPKWLKNDDVICEQPHKAWAFSSG